MSILVPSEFNTDKYHKAENVLAADHLIKLKDERPIWEVVDEVIRVWMTKNPTAFKSFVITTEKTRKTRANEFGANKREGLRYTLDFPEWVMSALRMLYTPDELPMDKEFFVKCWERYPVFRVSEKS